MFAARIVEAVDFLKEVIADVDTDGSCVPPDLLGFEGFEVGFDSCIIVAISFAAH